MYCIVCMYVCMYTGSDAGGWGVIPSYSERVCSHRWGCGQIAVDLEPSGDSGGLVLRGMHVPKQLHSLDLRNLRRCEPHHEVENQEQGIQSYFQWWW